MTVFTLIQESLHQNYCYYLMLHLYVQQIISFFRFFFLNCQTKKELNTGKLTVGKIYGGLLILENWKTTRFGQIEASASMVCSANCINFFFLSYFCPFLVYYLSFARFEFTPLYNAIFELLTRTNENYIITNKGLILL